jgi:hypothetical protein
MTYEVIVAGGRDWKDRETIYCVLDEELEEHRSRWFEDHREDPDFDESAPEHERLMLQAFVLRHGVCEGADWIANDWGKERGVTIERFPAQWKVPVTGAYDPSAGPRRNREMAKKLPRAAKLLAFWTGKMRVKFGKKEYSGTLDMIQAALAEGIPVRITPPRKDAA